MDLQPGSAFGPYRIVAPLGRGGMAAVYEAHDPSLDRSVALKVLPAEFLHDPAFAERFRQEARVAAKLEHPHIVPIHAYGIEGGRPWMAMRLVRGGSLADRVRRSPLAPREAASLLCDVAGALDYAHRQGIVHRDVKPANVLLDESGRAYLADFGIAKMLEGSSVATATGLIQGTPAYMAPEQAMGGKVDHSADVYALGVMAFECLTGRVPYTGTTPVAVLMKHVQEPVPEPAAAEVAPPLTAVLRRCLAKTPSERWPSAGAFSAALEQAASGATPPGGLAPLPTLHLPPTPATGTPRTGASLPSPPAAESPVRRNLLWAAAGAVASLVVLALAGFLLVPRLIGPERPPSSSTSLPAPSRPSESLADRGAHRHSDRPPRARRRPPGPRRRPGEPPRRPRCLPRPRPRRSRHRTPRRPRRAPPPGRRAGGSASTARRSSSRPSSERPARRTSRTP